MSALPFRNIGILSMAAASILSGSSLDSLTVSDYYLAPGEVAVLKSTRTMSPIEAYFKLRYRTLRISDNKYIPEKFVANSLDEAQWAAPSVYGDYKLELSLWQNGNFVSTRAVIVTVDAPLTAVDDSYEIKQDEVKDFGVTTNDTLVNGAIINNIQGLTSQGGIATINGNKINYTPPNAFVGKDTFTYSIRDNSGTSSSATVTVTIKDLGDPKANDDYIETNQDVPIHINILGNDNLVDNAVRDHFDAITVNGGHVGISHQPGGKLWYTPPAGFIGEDSFTYTIKDDDSPTPHTSTATVHIKVLDLGDPTANNDTFVTTENITINSMDILANDDMIDNAVLDTFDVLSSKGGTITRNADGTFKYVPKPNFNGTDTFTYRIKDDDSPTPHTSTATVTIDVRDAGTPKANDDSVTCIEDHSKLIDVTANDNMNDNAILTTFSTVTTKGGRVSFNSTTGQLNYTPKAAFVGIDTFTYTIEDDDLPTHEKSTATVTVTVVDEGSPVAKPDTFSTSENVSINSMNLLANDTLTDNAVYSSHNGTTSKGGTVTRNADGTFKYVPKSGFNGTDTFTYTIKDDDSPTPSTSTATVTISVVDTGNPTAKNDSYTTNENVNINSMDILANDNMIDNAVLKKYDSFTSKGGTVTRNADGTFKYVPKANFNGTDTFTYTIKDDDVPTPHTSTATVTITVTDTGDPIARNDSYTTNQDVSINSMNLLANDTLTDNAVYSSHNGTTSKGGTVTRNADGTFKYVPKSGFNGTDTFTYTIKDDDSPTPHTSTATVTITVKQVVTCQAEVLLGSSDDGYYSATLLHNVNFRGSSYNSIYAGANGYVTFGRGYSNYGSGISAIAHGIFPNTNKDIMTNVYITECTNKTVIRWDGGYFYGWHGTWNYTLTIKPDGTATGSGSGSEDGTLGNPTIR